MRLNRLSRLFVYSVLLAAAAGCAPDENGPQADSAAAMPPLETRADSVAMQVYETMGGPAAWAALPYLRFNFGFERDGTQEVGRRHLWNRKTGAYRLEWTQGADSAYVALFNVDTREGQVYLNGAPLDSAANAERLQGAYSGFINDTYWLFAPVKMMDPGVERTYVADSSGADTDVIQLSFQNVGLTPGDRYWMYVDRETGRVYRWAFILQNMPPEGPARAFDWTGYEAFETPAGVIYMASRKEAVGQPFALLTNAIETPAEVPQDLFSDPTPRL